MTALRRGIKPPSEGQSGDRAEDPDEGWDPAAVPLAPDETTQGRQARW